MASRKRESISAAPGEWLRVNAVSIKIKRADAAVQHRIVSWQPGRTVII
jgi:hypothetical protein